MIVYRYDLEGTAGEGDTFDEHADLQTWHIDGEIMIESEGRFTGVPRLAIKNSILQLFKRKIAGPFQITRMVIQRIHHETR